MITNFSQPKWNKQVRAGSVTESMGILIRGASSELQANQIFWGKASRLDSLVAKLVARIDLYELTDFDVNYELKELKERRARERVDQRKSQSRKSLDRVPMISGRVCSWHGNRPWPKWDYKYRSGTSRFEWTCEIVIISICI